MSSNREYLYEKKIQENGRGFFAEGSLERMQVQIAALRESMACLLYVLVENRRLTQEQADGIAEGWPTGPKECEDREDTE